MIEEAIREEEARTRGEHHTATVDGLKTPHTPQCA